MFADTDVRRHWPIEGGDGANDKKTDPCTALLASSLSVAGNMSTPKNAIAHSNTTTSEASTILNASPKLPSCYIRPHPNTCLFVAWNGVLVLVFSGFPEPLVAAKERLGTLLPDLAPEKFGSKWPKTTLGAVVDDAADLTIGELRRLRGICMEYTEKIRASKHLLLVNSLSCVDYDCRGLEKLKDCLLYTSPSPRDVEESRMPSSA